MIMVKETLGLLLSLGGMYVVMSPLFLRREEFRSNTFLIGTGLLGMFSVIVGILLIAL